MVGLGPGGAPSLSTRPWHHAPKHARVAHHAPRTLAHAVDLVRASPAAHGGINSPGDRRARRRPADNAGEMSGPAVGRPALASSVATLAPPGLVRENARRRRALQVSRRFLGAARRRALALAPRALAHGGPTSATPTPAVKPLDPGFARSPGSGSPGRGAPPLTGFRWCEGPWSGIGRACSGAHLDAPRCVAPGDWAGRSAFPQALAGTPTATQQARLVNLPVRFGLGVGHRQFQDLTLEPSTLEHERNGPARVLRQARGFRRAPSRQLEARPGLVGRGSPASSLIVPTAALEMSRLGRPRLTVVDVEHVPAQVEVRRPIGQVFCRPSRAPASSARAGVAPRCRRCPRARPGTRRDRTLVHRLPSPSPIRLGSPL